MWNPLAGRRGTGKLNIAVLVGGKGRAETNNGNSKRGLASVNEDTRGQFMLSDNTSMGLPAANDQEAARR